MKQSTCHYCGAQPGELHQDGCDVERCPDCGNQLLSCGCDQLTHERIPWDGTWPGARECQEYGFWCYWGPPWISCDKDHPGAREDLNRLLVECDWDANAKRWVLPNP